ncbi:MAG: class I tRNA ligase family protein [Planctomycetota bacterium]
MFELLPSQFSFPEAEERVLAFWERHKIFERSLEQRRADVQRREAQGSDAAPHAGQFVFYEGPPTANGLPHPGHCLTRAIKDLFPRYQTMCGKLVERKAGWDTHGLPVEVEVQKELGISTKEEIEAYGVEKFIRRCIESVFRYTREWEQMTRRLGFWVNLEEAYVTYHQSYVESVWWSLKTLFERGLLYQGHKIVWWWPQGGTALSSGEVGEGYRTVEDPSVYVRFPLLSEPERQRGAAGEAVSHQPSAVSHQPSVIGRAVPAGSRVSLLVWTTTPWTLISNHFAAVGPDIDYVLVHDAQADEYLVIAAALVDAVGEKVKRKYEVVSNLKGTDLIGLRYLPPFGVYYNKATDRTSPGRPGPEGASPSPGAPARLGDVTAALKDGGEDYIGWRVTPATFVTLDTGTGLVHEAPAYGEVDFDLLQEERRRFADYEAVPLLNAVKPDGTFNDDAPPQWRGRYIKDCDREIIRDMKERGLLLHQEMYKHDYPFCPRAEDDPLIQYARQSWFVRTSQFKEEFLKNNAAIYWLPDHIKEGRFGDFLRNNVDWALSRERYWGTPLPIWRCEQTGKMEAVGSLAELMAKPGATDGGAWERAKAADPSLPDHLRVHKPYIDEWTYDSLFADEPGARATGGTLFADEPGAQATGGSPGATGTSVAADSSLALGARKPRMRRVPEVIDCWWDAGSMPFAQWGFPHAPKSVDTFTSRFPADFISEAIDQTRGWFYGLLAISTLLFSERTLENATGVELNALKGMVTLGKGPELELLVRTFQEFPHPYRACIVLGHVMGEDGLKMSKRTKNYKEPSYIFEKYGADAMRWFFFSAQTPWTSIRFQEANIRDAQREFLVRLYNVFSFFNIYANIDGFVPDPQHGSPWRPTAERSELDRWIISELQLTIRFVRESMDKLENYPAAGRINAFVDALSNWYVRRSRDRFWRHEQDQDKWDAYHTLYGVLWTLSQLIAPFTPFFAEVMYRNLTGQEEGPRGRGAEGPSEETRAPAMPPSTGSAGASPSHSAAPVSVHLCDYPVADESLIDEDLAREMDLVRDIVSLGRAARTAAKLKVRQPLARVEIILARREHTEWLEGHSALVAEELNIKRVEFTTEADQYVRYQIKPEFKALGPKFGKLAPRVAAAVAQLDSAEARRDLETSGRLVVHVDGQPVVLTDQEVAVRLEARPGWSAAQGRAGVVVVQTELTDDLRAEGLCREVIHHVQALRKEQDLPYEARIVLYVQGPEPVLAVVRRYAETIKSECLATRIEETPPPADAARVEAKIEGHAVVLGLRRVAPPQ